MEERLRFVARLGALTDHRDRLAPVDIKADPVKLTDIGLRTGGAKVLPDPLEGK
jgi:hypothetical protein